MRPTPEDEKVLTFARDIRLGQLPATVVILREWLNQSKVEVLRETEMEAAKERLELEQPRLAKDTPRPERVSVPQANLSPLSLVHLLMISPFLSPSNTCHMIHAKADAMGITKQVIPFMEWLTAETGEP